MRQRKKETFEYARNKKIYYVYVWILTGCWYVVMCRIHSLEWISIKSLCVLTVICEYKTSFVLFNTARQKHIHNIYKQGHTDTQNEMRENERHIYIYIDTGREPHIKPLNIQKFADSFWANIAISVSIKC